MPWDIVTRDGKHCVRKKDGGEILKCYSSESDAKAYLGALYANVHKEYSEAFDTLVRKEFAESLVLVEKEDDRYKITSVSTAAIPDREDETFSIEAIDYDAKLASSLGVFPEYRVFHNKHLGIGRVEKMSRIGIFAIDEGHSYTDPFSLDVSEKMLLNNDGRWGVSRGFYVLEASGGCPDCGSALVVKKEHMLFGFRCPNCHSVYPSYKGVLKDLHFRKARTFDVTITDIPCVPYTGVAAVKPVMLEEFKMNKSQIKERLLEAGIDEELIESRLKSLTNAQLKSLGDMLGEDGVPDAVLKEFDDAETSDADEQVFTLDEDVIDEFVEKSRKVVADEVQEQFKHLFENLEVDLGGMENLSVSMKEVPEIESLQADVTELKEAVNTLTDAVKSLLEKDDKRLKEQLRDAPRSGKLRLLRMKASDMEDDEEDNMDDEDEDETDQQYKSIFEHHDNGEGVVLGSDGKPRESMTEFIANG